MFRKLGRALGGSGKGTSIKVQFDLQVVQVDNLPQAVRKCRVVWARSAKVQMTNIKDVRNGVAVFKHKMTQVTSVHKDKSGDYEPKDYTIKVQVPQGVTGDNIMTIGKANVNLARYVGEETNTQTDVIPIAFKVGHSSTGYVKVTITSTHLGEVAEDGMTEVSGLTGLTSEGGAATVPEQDLDGFDEGPSPSDKKSSKSRNSPDSASTGTSKKTSSRRPQALPTTREESESELEDEKPVGSKSRGRSDSKGRSAANSGPDFGRKAGSSTGGAGTAKPAPRPKWDDDEDISSVSSLDEDDLDARPQSSKPAAATKDKPKKGLLGLMQKKEEPEEEEPPKKPAAPKVKEPEPDLFDMKQSLFGETKKDTGSSKAKADAGSSKAGGRDKGAGSSKAAPPVDLDDEDAARAALFSAPPSKPKASKSASKPEPVPDDEEAARAALFGAPSKPAAKATAKPSSKIPAAPEIAPDDEEAARAALFGASSPSKLPKPSKAAKSKEPSGFDDFGEEPAFPSAADPVEEKMARKASSKARKTADEDDGVAAPPAGSKKAAAGASSAELSQALAENDKLRQQIEQMQLREKQLSKQVRELEDKLAEVDVDPAEMFAQLQEMEKKHSAELARLKKEYEAQIEELEEALEEARAAGAAGGAAAAGKLAAREAELNRLEAEARAKLSEANRMVDEQLLTAVKAQQEKKSLQEEVEKLRAQLQAAGSRRDSLMGSDDEDPALEKLRGQLAALEKENEELRKRGGELEAITVAVSGGGAPDGRAVKPVELHTRIHELTTANERLTEEAALLRHENQELQAKATQLTAGLEAATAQAAAASATRRSLGEGSSGGNSAATRAILEQLEKEKNTLEAQLSEARYELKQIKSSTGMNMQSLQAEVARLTEENERLAVLAMGEVGTTASSPGPGSGPAAAASAIVAAAVSSAGSKGSPGRDGVKLMEEAATLRAELAQAQREKVELEARIEEYKEAETVIAEWEEYANSLGSERDAAVAEAEDLRKQLEDLEQRLSQRTAARSASAASADAAALAAARADLEAARQEVEELEEEMSSLKAQNEQLRSDVGRRSARSASSADAAALAQARAELGEAQQEIERLEEQASTLQEQVSSLQEENAGLRNELQSLQAELAQTQRSLQEAQDQLHHNQQEVLGMQMQLQAAQRAAADATAAAAAAEAAAAAARTAAPSGSSPLSEEEVDKVISEWEEYANGMATERDEALKQLEEVRAREQDLQAQVASLQAEVSQLQEQQQQQGAPQSVHMRQPSLSNEELEQAQAALAAAKRDNTRLQAEVEALTSQNEDLHATIEELKEAISELQQKHDDMSATTAAAQVAVVLAPEPEVAGRGLPGRGASHRTSASGISEPVSASPLASSRASEQGEGQGAEAGPGSTLRRGWDARNEALLQERDALAAKVKGLEQALHAAQAAAAAARVVSPSPMSRHRPPDYGSDSEDEAETSALTESQPTESGVTTMDEAYQVSKLLEEKAALQAELASVLGLLARAPLVPSAGTTGAAPATDTGSDDLVVRQLNDKVKLLTDWRKNAESTLATLQAEQQALKADRAEAMATAAEAEKRCKQLEARLEAAKSAEASAGVQSLRSQIQELQAQLAASKQQPQATPGGAHSTVGGSSDGSAAGPAHSDDESDSRSGGGSNSTALARRPSGRSIGASQQLQAGHEEPPSPSPATEVGRLRGQLNTAAAVIFVTRRAMSSCLRVVTTAEPPAVTEDVELDVALMHMKDEALGLFQELQRQAREAPRFEAQLAAASQRVEELEEQVEELQGENQALAAMQPISGAGHGNGSGRMGGMAVGSRGDASMAAMNPLFTGSGYADDTGLALSALEQQLHLAEVHRDEAQASLEAVGRENARLAAEVGQLRAELALKAGSSGRPIGTGAFASQVAAAASARNAGGRSGSLSRKSSGANISDDSDEGGGVKGSLAARRATKALQKELDSSRAEADALRAQCEKLEAVCEDLERRAAEERAALEAQLEEALARSANAAAAGTRGKAQDAAGGPDVAELRSKLAEAEASASRAARENVRLAGLLDDEQAAREVLEEQVKRGLADMGDDEAVEAVEAFEVKYGRLKDRYKQLEAAAAEEAEELTAQLLEAQDALRKAQQQAASTGPGAAAAGAHSNGAAAAGVSTKEFEALRNENEQLVSQLVAKQMELAELAEQQAMLRRDLYRAKEVNMKLASKMTKLEAQAYSAKGGKAAGKKEAKKGGKKAQEAESSSGEETD